MGIARNVIIETLVDRREPNPSVLAMWLEGADATAYSFCCERYKNYLLHLFNCDTTSANPVPKSVHA